MTIPYTKTEPEMLPWDKLTKGDIITYEYGDYGNFITIAFDKGEAEPNSHFIKITGRLVMNGQPHHSFAPAYGGIAPEFKKIGKEN